MVLTSSIHKHLDSSSVSYRPTADSGDLVSQFSTIIKFIIINISRFTANLTRTAVVRERKTLYIPSIQHAN